MRESLGLTVRGLAQDADVNPGYLSEVERGNKTPSRRWLHAVTSTLANHMAKGAS